jgi:hypothetical protein
MIKSLIKNLPSAAQRETAQVSKGLKRKVRAVGCVNQSKKVIDITDNQLNISLNMKIFGNVHVKENTV